MPTISASFHFSVVAAWSTSLRINPPPLRLRDLQFKPLLLPPKDGLTFFELPNRSVQLGHIIFQDVLSTGMLRSNGLQIRLQGQNLYFEQIKVVKQPVPHRNEIGNRNCARYMAVFQVLTGGHLSILRISSSILRLDRHGL